MEVTSGQNIQSETKTSPWGSPLWMNILYLIVLLFLDWFSYDNTCNEKKPFCFIPYKQYRIKVDRRQKFQTAMKRSASIFCLQLNFLSPTKYFALDWISYDRTYSKRANVSSRSLYAIRYRSQSETKKFNRTQKIQIDFPCLWLKCFSPIEFSASDWPLYKNFYCGKLMSPSFTLWPIPYGSRAESNVSFGDKNYHIHVFSGG